MEVEILVAEVGTDASHDRLFHILYDGTVMDEDNFTVLGGQAEAVDAVLAERYEPGMVFDAAIRLGADVLSGPDESALPVEQLEIAFLDRQASRRTFRRITGDERVGILAG